MQEGFREASPECRRLRSVFDDLGKGVGAARGQPDEQLILEHFAECADCRDWQSQTIDLVSQMSAMPQFDVSEALTQRILASVRDEESTRLSTAQMVSMAVATGVAVAFLCFDSLESAAGLASWLVGLSALFLLKPLLDGHSSHGKVVRR
jgi:predicted anti-sigma-YlaC factor YlaD